PDMSNFQQIAQTLMTQDSMKTVHDAQELCDAVTHLWRAPAELRRMQSTALDVARARRDIADIAFQELGDIFAKARLS
ncbi:MAG: hypothetical protein AAF352_02605, partial [Pseudomonadota bacterium]